MAKAKSNTKKSSAKSKGSSASTKRSTSGSARSKSARSASSQADVSLAQASYGRAKEFVGSNANLPTAGLALAGAGVLALVSTQAGRNLIKAAADAVVSLVNLPAIQEQIEQTMAPLQGKKSGVQDSKQKQSQKLSKQF